MELLDSHKKIIKILKRGHFSVPDLAEETQYQQGSIRGRLADLKKWGFEIKRIRHDGRTFYYIPEKGLEEQRLLKISSGSHVYRVGIIADTHLCSKHCDMVALNDFYDEVVNQGIKEVFHAGDLLTGWNVYRGQQNEIEVFGFDNQVNYVINNYPKRKGVKTFFILGNHDARIYELETVDPGKIISMKRPDMVYLGQYEADIMFEDVKLRLLHPDGGAAYAKSYLAQKYISGLVPGEKPNILCRGHLHQVLYMFDRNIHAFECGCYERQNLWLRRKGLMATVGGWIIEFKIKNGNEVNDLIPKLRVYYKKGDLDSVTTKREFSIKELNSKKKREYYGEKTFLEK